VLRVSLNISLPVLVFHYRNRVAKRISCPKKQELRGVWGGLLNEELYNDSVICAFLMVKCGGGGKEEGEGSYG
jgi:hypothetical protein